MTSTSSAKAASDLFASIARELGRGGDALELAAHQCRAARLEAAPAAERRDEARGGLRIERIEREDQVGDEPITPASRSAKSTGAQSAVTMPSSRPGRSVAIASALGRASNGHGAVTVTASAEWTW